MIAILRLIWGLLSRSIPALLLIGSKIMLVYTAIRASHAAMKAAAIVALILWLPMPAWLTAIPGYVAAIPAEVVYVMKYARVAEGMGIILSAYVIRFLARLMLKVID